MIGSLRPHVASQVRKHPAYAELVRRYRQARQTWRDNPGVQAVAIQMGMTEETYCNALIAEYDAILWTSTTDTTDITFVPNLAWEHYHLAYREAAP